MNEKKARTHAHKHTKREKTNHRERMYLVPAYACHLNSMSFWKFLLGRRPSGFKA